MNVEINQFNHTGLMNKYASLFNDGKYWHQIVVQNVEGLDRDVVLNSIMKSCHPLDFIPVQYTSVKNTAKFLLKNCEATIRKLCNQNLVVINPHNDNKPFIISVRTCSAKTNELKIDIHNNLKTVLMKRYSSETRILNLSNFAKDAELQQYCALSQPKLLFYVLHIAKNIPFRTLKLSNNDIHSLKPMESLDGSSNPIMLDLRNNCIQDTSDLEQFKHLHVIELWLDGNPICNNYSDITYGKSIKLHVKHLEKLDGVNVKSQEFPRFRRNFLCDLTGYDLVDQFLEHYFTLYDSQNRSVLKEMYHRDALFSLTSMYIPLQSTSSTAELMTYKKIARNIRQMIDFSKNTNNLFIGPFLITNILTSLPETEHDPYSFTADLMMCTDKVAVLVVTGVFRECTISLWESDRLLGFTRTFVLMPGENGEYSIINEMLNITNATTTQASRAFKQMRTPKLECTDLPRPQNIKDLQDTIDAFRVITGLKTDWARRCLEENDYDLKQGLELFIQLFKQDKIPKWAFDSEEKIKESLTSLSKVANTSVIRKQLTNEPKPTASPKINSRPTSQSTPVILPKANTDADIKARSTTPAVGIARPINRLTSPTSLRAEQLPKPVSKVVNKKTTKEKNKNPKVVDIIDLTESSKEPRGRAIPSLFDRIIQPADLLPPSPSLSGQPSNVPVATTSTSNDEEKKNEQNMSGIDLIVEAKFQMKRFKIQFERIQTIFKQNEFKKSETFIKKLLLANRIHYEAFEMVFMWYYKTNLEHARDLKDNIMKLSHNVKPFLSHWQLELLIATCECVHGNFELGETEFRKLIAARQNWMRPIREFCRILLRKNQVEKARSFLKPLVTKSPLKVKIQRMATELSKPYKVDLLSV